MLLQAGAKGSQAHRPGRKWLYHKLVALHRQTIGKTSQRIVTHRSLLKRVGFEYSAPSAKRKPHSWVWVRLGPAGTSHGGRLTRVGPRKWRALGRNEHRQTIGKGGLYLRIHLLD